MQTKSSESSQTDLVPEDDTSTSAPPDATSGGTSTNGQTSPGRTAHSLSGGLLAALAAREAIYNVNDPPAGIQEATAGQAAPAATPRAAAAPVDAGDSEALLQRIAQLEKERDALAQGLDDVLTLREERDALRMEAEQVQRESQQLVNRLLDAEKDCAERDRRLQALEAELKELFENGLDTSTSAHPDYENLERRYHGLVAEHEEHRRRSADEITSLNEQITEARRQVQQGEQAQAQAAAAAASAQAKPEKSADQAKLEAKYKTLLNDGEKDRRRHAQEIAAMSEHLSQTRNREQKLLVEIEKLRASGAMVVEEQPEPLSQRPILGAPPPTMATAPGSGPPTLGLKSTVTKSAAPGGPVSSAEMILLDPTEVGEDVLQRVAKYNLAIEQPPAAADVVSYCSGPSTVCLLANLALPIAWTLIRKFRTSEKTRHLQVIGYALPPRADLGFWFGRVDIALYPSGSTELLDMIRRIGPSGSKQAIGIGANEQLMQELTRTLARDRVRVTTALDRRQALDAVRSVYPELTIIYPTPNPVDAFRALASIREIAAFKDLPLILLLDDEAKEREDEKLSGGVRTILRLGNLVPDDLATLIPISLNQSKAILRGPKR